MTYYSLKTFLLLILLVSLPLFKGFSQSTAKVRFDGLYQSNEIALGVSGYIRFYPDSLVLKVYSTGSFEKVSKWLIRPYESDGKYRIINNEIYIETIHHTDREYPGLTITSEGTINSEFEIILKGSGGGSEDLTYHFRKF